MMINMPCKIKCEETGEICLETNSLLEAEDFAIILSRANPDYTFIVYNNGYKIISVKNGEAVNIW